MIAENNGLIECVRGGLVSRGKFEQCYGGRERLGETWFSFVVVTEKIRLRLVGVFQVFGGRRDWRSSLLPQRNHVS